MNPHPRILLGDQYPAGGGFLRYAAVRAAYRDSEVQYCIQDADSPWADKGLGSVRVVDNWTDYWSIGSRLPWTPDVPGHQISDVLATFKAPRGLAYLSGPGKSYAIYGIQKNNKVWPAVSAGLNGILERETKWALKVADVCGLKTDAARMEAIAEETRNAYDDPSRSVVEMFRASPSVLINDLPVSMYWAIDRDGRRVPCTAAHKSQRDYILVPRGIALPLEYAARGLTIAATSIGYLTRSIEVRDRYLPRQKVGLITVEFNWNPPVDPVHTMLDEFYARKKKRQQVPREISDVDIGGIKRYWCGRPTSMSYAALGGALNPTFEHHVL